MNIEHRTACAGDEWRATVRDHIVPWVLADLDLGDDVIELGPGFGAATDVLRERIARMTAVEIDAEISSFLVQRFANSNVHVVTGDATALEFADARFSGAVSFAMLHHVPTPALQDRVLAEARRVVRPGGLVVLSDSRDRPDLRAFHHDDTYVPIDPEGLPARLRAAGFDHVEVDQNDFAWKATASCRSGV